ncbi:MAG: ATP synthase F1 subunit epsilon [Bacteroidia bacterium]|nr:ATP synthase F1 subunit epsilon [Bacteroidia bacterium]
MLYLEIISPEKLLFAGEITIIKLPGVSGSFEIMKNHVPIISTLKQGKIKVKETSGIVSYFDVEGGLVEVSNNEVKVLVE